MTTREELRQSGQAIRKRLGFPDMTPETELAPGFNRLAQEMVFGSIWARPGLALEDRMIAVLAALTSAQRLPQLRRYVGGALNLGLSARTIQEVPIHCGLYAGFPTILNALAETNAVFVERGIAVPDTEMPEHDAEALMALGEDTMHALHGTRAQGSYAAPDNTTTAMLYQAAVAYGYGEIWNRPDLDRRQRMICAVASFTALCHDE